MYQEPNQGHQWPPDLQPYQGLLQFCKENSSVINLYGAFVPRRFGKMLVKEGEDIAYENVIKLGYMDTEDVDKGSDDHYDFFESLISGRDLSSDEEPGEQFKKIFPAQVLKDSVMASVIRRGLEASDNAEDKFLVIAGSGHIDYRSETFNFQKNKFITYCKNKEVRDWDEFLVTRISAQVFFLNFLIEVNN